MQTLPTAPSLVPSHDDFVMIAGQPFSESEYLEMNPDVRAYVREGRHVSGREHFELVGLAEGRVGVAPFGMLAEKFFGEQSVETEKLQEYRAEKFPYAGPHPWLDCDDWREQVDAKLRAGEMTEYEASMCEKWTRDGYIILDEIMDHGMLDQAWADYEEALRAGVVKPERDEPAPGDTYPGRYLDPHLKVPAMCQVLRHPAVLRWIKLFMGREPAPFQTIASHKGSEQGAHSDSIHMTTYPLGYLTASWVAFEDIHPDSGPLVYYPGSHKLPYYFSKDVGIAEGDFGRNGYKVYKDKYEPWIKRVLSEHDFKPHHFLAKKGQVLLWHANLIHGGSRRTDYKHSRKAVVCHYFVRGAVTYHDLSGTKARQHTGTCLLHTQRD